MYRRKQVYFTRDMNQTRLVSFYFQLSPVDSTNVQKYTLHIFDQYNCICSSSLKRKNKQNLINRFSVLVASFFWNAFLRLIFCFSSKNDVWLLVDVMESNHLQKINKCTFAPSLFSRVFTFFFCHNCYQCSVFYHIMLIFTFI